MSKTNLKFVISSKGINKSANKNGGGISTDFSSTINLNTNNRVKDKYITKKLQDDKAKAIEKLTEISGNGNVTNNISMVPKKIEKRIERVDNNHVSSYNGLIMKAKEFRAVSKENVRETYGSNSSVSLKNGNKIPVSGTTRSKHQKTLSEIPMMSLKNHITEGHTPVNHGKSNLFELYNQTTATERLREINQKTSLDPKIINIKAQSLFRENLSSRGVSKSSNHLKEASVNCLKRKLNTTGDEAQNSEESNFVTNTSNNIPIPKAQDKYAALLIKFKEQEKHQRELMRTIDIFRSYIKSTEVVTNKIKNEISDKLNRKNNEIKHLQEENKIIIKENKELKMSLLEVIYQVKLYENKESERETQLNKLFSQVLTENEYLRYSNEAVIGKSLCRNKEISDEKEIQFKDLIKNTNINEDDDTNKQKGIHKRQKTHINFHLQTLTIKTAALSEVDASNTVNTSTSEHNISTNTIVNTENEDENILNSTLKSMNSLQNMKKIVNSYNQVATSENANLLSPTTKDGSQSQRSQKQVHLFYRTPSNKEHKKIEFSK